MNKSNNSLNSGLIFACSRYSLIVCQQPNKGRLCSFKEKVDRRPIDPPPIVQLLNNSPNNDFLNSLSFFLYATLTDMSGDSDLHFINGNSTTAGAVVQSPHKLKDLDGRDGGFFIFSDISVRLEGVYRLKFTLFEIEGNLVNRLCSILSDPFKVYLPKNFPGMSESTFLTKHFSDQGVRIRVRKEPRSTRLSHNSNKRRRTNLNESDDEGPSLHNSVIEKRQQESSLPPVSCFGGLPSPQDCIIPQHEDRPNLPPPKQLFQSSAMSMQNILSKNRSQLCHISAIDYRADENRLISTRKLPLPYQEQTKCYQNGITELLNTDPSSFTWFSKN